MYAFRRFACLTLAAFVQLWTAQQVAAAPDPLTIYIDADYTTTPAPAEAIETGLRAAFAGTWAEEGIRIVPKDHRGNARRSLDTFQSALHDPSAIAVMGGMQSPPYFANGDVINQSGLPLLLPWSAGGMLTRLGAGADNWIMRLSVDDTKAAAKLADFSYKRGCQRPAVMFVDNPWGNGNAKRLVAEFEALAGIFPSSHPLPFNAGQSTVVKETRGVMNAGADCVILVSGLTLGKLVMEALAAQEKPPKVISHWGILGDRLTQHMSAETIERIRLAILGTCGVASRDINSNAYNVAYAKAMQVSGDRFNPAHHPAPHGFFHAYDWGLLLLRAIEQARGTDAWSQGPDARRAAVRAALYEQDRQVHGILKTYDRPFSPVTPENQDGHEALGRDDLCMTKVDPDGNIVSLNEG